MSCCADARVAALEFTGEWRHYQELALAAFQRDVDAGRRRTHIVAPPGSGKTLLGVEIVHRLAAPALVLVPNTVVQAQWLAAVAQFSDGGASPPVTGRASPPVTSRPSPPVTRPRRSPS